MFLQAIQAIDYYSIGYKNETITEIVMIKY